MVRVRIAALLLAACAKAGTGEPRRVALTFDDVPREPGAFFTPDERTRRLLAALDRAGVEQAAFFVTTGHLEKPWGEGGEARIAAYVDAGHVIANHSHAHAHLSETPADDYVTDLDRAEAWLRDRPGRRPWFRFPYLDEGRRDLDRQAAVREALAERGLRNAYVTIDGYDWYLEQRAVDAARDGRPLDVAALGALYVEQHLGAAAFHDQLARRALGRSPAHVLLLHETDVAALFVADLVSALRRDGWTVVTADEAFADPVYAAAPDVPWAQGTLTGRLAREAGLPPPWVYPGNEPALLDAAFDARVLGGR